jgi:hypothetical protein
VTERTSEQDAADYKAAATQLIDQDASVSDVAPMDSLGHDLLGEFEQAALQRRETEERWLEDLRQFRGRYSQEVLTAIGKERSHAFVRKTRVKIKTINSRVTDLLFPAGTEKNWNIDPTPKPRLSPDQVVEIRKQLGVALTQAAQAAAQSGQPAPTKPTRTQFDQVVTEWAKTRCKAMSDTIEDQLSTVNYKATCRQAIHSGHLYGTGIIKGPLVERRVRTRFVNQGGKWVPQSETYVVPFVEYVPVWNFYPDMAAAVLDDCRFVYQRHLMSAADMADLASRSSFNSKRIKAYVIARPDGELRQRHVDTELRVIGNREAGMADHGGKFEVLERWGWLSGIKLRDAGVEVDDDRLHESFFSNVWLLPNGEIIKAVLQPIDGTTWPYHLYYCDKDESSIFAEGIAAIMRDDQTMLNAATRMILDNAAMTAGPQIEITPSLLTGTQNITTITPWKTWHRNNTNPGQPAIRAIDLPSRLNELSAIVQMFETNADETTAIPRYMSGDNATSGAAGTSSGLSMLMGSANIVVKDLVMNWDDVSVSFIRGMYFWNMQFNPDDAIKGDFDVSARGTSSLVAKEVRAQALDNFASLTANQLDAPYIKRDVLNRQRAEALELTGVVKTEDEVKAEQSSAQAQQMQQMQLQMQQAQLAEAQAKAQKLAADAQLITNKAQEVLANIDLIVANKVKASVEAAYAALQAGGVATNSPYTAPAGDQILRDAGWKSAVNPSNIAQLNGPPVQETEGVDRVLNKGQSFAEEPRVTAGGQVAVPHAPGADAGTEATPQPATGQQGQEAGIETPATPN